MILFRLSDKRAFAMVIVSSRWVAKILVQHARESTSRVHFNVKNIFVELQYIYVNSKLNNLQKSTCLAYKIE